MGTQTTGNGNSYSCTLPSLPLGIYTLTCTAVDAQGAQTTSFPVNVVLSNNGLVGWWKFDEDSGSTSADSSGIGDNLTLNGTSWTSGKFGSALSFNGSASATGQSRSVGGFVPRNTLTASAWVQSSASTWSGGLFVYQSENYYLGPTVGGGTTGVRFGIYVWGSFGATEVDYTPAAGFNITAWHHYAGSYDGTNLNLYIDGALVAQKALSLAVLSDNVNGIQIGCQDMIPGDTNTSFNGTIDSVRLYNYALSAAQIDALATATTDTGAAPTTSITSPSNNTIIAGNFTIAATATDTESAISEVQFYANSTLLGTVTSSPYSYTWSNPTPGAYMLTTIAYSNGLCVMSAPIGITVLGPPQSPWSTSDIGAVGIPGNAGESTDGTVFEVTGSGAGFTDPNDAFRYLYQQVSGNCTVIAYVESFPYDGYDSWAAAGVEMRATLNANSAHAFIGQNPITYVESFTRTTTGGSTTNTLNHTGACWVEVVRSGSNITCNFSTDGVTWTQSGSTVSIPMTDPIYVGLAVTSTDNSYLCTGTFDNVGVTTGSSQCATPTFNPVAGTYGTTQSVTISTTTGGASINYTTNGITPSSTLGTVYSSPVAISANTTLQAIAYESGYSNSSVASGVYTIQCATPSYSPAAGTYASTQSVTISTSTSGATIRYTTNGTTPSSTVGTVYSSAVSISATCTLQAIAYESGLSNSNVASGVYTITGTCATPTFNPAAGTYGAAQSVTISTTTGGASIRYTTNGTTPNSTVGTVYSSAVSITANTTLQAIAYETGYTNSSVASGVYTIQCAAPTFNPAAGAYGPAQSVTISTTTGGASIRYTTNGTTPSSTVGTVYSSPVSISATSTLEAIAYETGLTNSTVITGVYTINGACATPTFNPAAGTFTTSTSVTISTTTGGATIRYTTNGTTPSSTVGTVYSSAVSITATSTLQAIAYETGYSNSSVASGVYTIQCATPTFNPTAGTFTTSRPSPSRPPPVAQASATPPTAPHRARRWARCTAAR